MPSCLLNKPPFLKLSVFRIENLIPVWSYTTPNEDACRTIDSFYEKERYNGRKRKIWREDYSRIICINWFYALSWPSLNSSEHICTCTDLHWGPEHVLVIVSTHDISMCGRNSFSPYTSQSLFLFHPQIIHKLVHLVKSSTYIPALNIKCN